jgi:cathepsin B
MSLSSIALSAADGASQAKLEINHHAVRQAEVDRLNAMPGMTWTAAVQERFAGHPIGHSTNLMGVKGNWTADTQALVDAGEIEEFVPTWTADAPIPDSFDSAEHFSDCAKIIDDIRDQSNCGCCWAFGGAEAASDRMCIASKGKLQFPLSAQDVCFNANPDGCDGGQITTPWQFISREGAVTGGQYQGSGPFGKGFCSDFSLPHCHHHGPKGNDPYPSENAPGCPHASSPSGPKKCDEGSTHTYDSDKYTFSGRVQTARGEKGIQQMIMEGGPVETAFSVYADFENYAGGIYQHKSGQMMGGHAVKFVGWGSEGGVDYWKVANSWNPYWGEKGYFRIKRGFGNEGGIQNMVTGSAADATWSKKSV